MKRYAISYVSSVSSDLTEDKIQEVLSFSKNWNNENNVTGILLYSEGNFFQVIEGEKSLISNLFKRIKNDKRHHNLIPIFEKEIPETSFEKYQAEFISVDAHFNSKDLNFYLSRVEKLDPSIQSSVRYILNKFTEGIKSS